MKAGNFKFLADNMYPLFCLLCLPLAISMCIMGKILMCHANNISYKVKTVMNAFAHDVSLPLHQNTIIWEAYIADNSSLAIHIYMQVVMSAYFIIPPKILFCN